MPRKRKSTTTPKRGVEQAGTPVAVAAQPEGEGSAQSSEVIEPDHVFTDWNAGLLRHALVAAGIGVVAVDVMDDADSILVYLDARTLYLTMPGELQDWSETGPSQIGDAIATVNLDAPDWIAQVVALCWEAQFELPATEAAELFPRMSESELRDLAEDIRARGLLEPIMLHDQAVLDGRNRLAACRLANVAPKFVDWPRDGRGSPTAWVLSKNIKRRQLTSSQAAVVAVAALPMVRADLHAAARRKDQVGEQLPQQVGEAGGGGDEQVPQQVGEDDEVDEQLPQLVGEDDDELGPHDRETNAIAAATFGTNRESVRRALKIQRSEAGDEILDLVRAGTMSLGDGLLLAGLPEKDREVALAEGLRGRALKRFVSTPTPAPEELVAAPVAEGPVAEPEPSDVAAHEAAMIAWLRSRSVEERMTWLEQFMLRARREILGATIEES